MLQFRDPRTYGVDFCQTVLTLRATLATQAQNEEVGQLTQASYAQNEEIKKISAWAAILLAPTLVGTIYGMNFEHMPELDWPSVTRRRCSLCC